VVVVITEQLKDRWAGLGADPVVIANGCSSSTSSPRPGLGVVVDLPRPVVGLVGQLSERIDMSLLEAVAGAGYSLLLVGPRDQRWEASRFADLVARPNVLYAGEVPAAAVPSYLAKIDVGITPYRDSAFNRASFPLKTLEYLSAGIPVVTTDLPSARWLRWNSAETLGNSAVDCALAIADNRGSFVDAITRICKRHDTVSCRRLAAQHSWSGRAELLAGVIVLPPIPSPDSPGTAIR
jgi:teichuronic acid biosynthesis glycosyltransferase TuaH